ncbi:MAG: GNAT family protein [Spirochaetales bacterium]|nr:GNAT family protein [Spirochaetales bacterium]
MKYFKKLTGPKVYLSPINTEDFPLYTKWLNDMSLAPFIQQDSRVVGLTGEKDFLEKMAVDQNSVHLAIVKNDGDELLGNVSLMDLNRLNRTAEMGIFMGSRENLGRGYGTEAVQIICEYGFRILGLQNIMLRVFSFNPRAMRAYEKAGFTPFGRRSGSIFFDGKQHDEIYMQMTPGDCQTQFLNEVLPHE